jgi:hypothetical protein
MFLRRKFLTWQDEDMSSGSEGQFWFRINGVS